MLAAAALGLPPPCATSPWVALPCWARRVRRLRQLAPDVSIRAVYGLTEALPVAVATGEQVLASPPGRTSLGRPLPGVSVRIDHPDVAGVGNIVAPGRRRATASRGSAPRARCAPVISGRSRRTARCSAGRAKSMIIRGQANIYPDLVEPLLLARADLGLHDCALVGLPDPVSEDERVALAVVPLRSGRSSRPTARALARAVHRVWPALAEEARRPDEVVVVEGIPRRGRSRAVDLDAARALVVAAPEGDRA